MTRVKICGLTRERDLEAAVAAGADAVGVVCDVSVDTPRDVSPETAANLVSAAPPFVTTVLVTMPTDVAEARSLLETVGADVLQVHGGLEPTALDVLRARTDRAVVAAVDAAEPDEASQYDDVVDALLVDSVDEAGGGGTGRTHDWERTRTVARAVDSPVVLAGGLTPANVAEAVRTVEPFAVDVASGVEARGGVKDHDAVESFVAAARTGSRPAEVGP